MASRPARPERPKDYCCLIPRHPPVFIVLGRSGDLILLLPAFLEIFRRTGMKPIVYVSRDYAGVLDGVSYVTPEVVKDTWYEGVTVARQAAEEKYGGAIVPAWWDDPETAYDIGTQIQEHGAMILQSHGRNWGVNCAENPDFGTSMWRRAGFSRQQMMELPLVFDRRDASREAELVKRFVRPGKPMLLMSLAGVSSPFGYVPELQRLIYPYRGRFNLVDLSTIRCYRIYDLLGLYDQAAGLITIDTATLHLCPASKVQSIQLIVPGWGSSVPKGNVVLHMKYDEYPKRAEEIRVQLEKWLA